jgi:hypothetical protein
MPFANGRSVYSLHRIAAALAILTHLQECLDMSL